MTGRKKDRYPASSRNDPIRDSALYIRDLALALSRERRCRIGVRHDGKGGKDRVFSPLSLPLESFYQEPGRAASERGTAPKTSSFMSITFMPVFLSYRPESAGEDLPGEKTLGHQAEYDIDILSEKIILPRTDLLVLEEHIYRKAVEED